MNKINAKYIFLISFALLTVSTQVRADSNYVSGCIKGYMFFIEQSLTDTMKINGIRKIAENTCGCQYNKLVEAGITEQEMSDFVDGAGEAKITPKSMAVAPKINDIINSNSVKTECGTIFNN